MWIFSISNDNESKKCHMVLMTNVTYDMHNPQISRMNQFSSELCVNWMNVSNLEVKRAKRCVEKWDGISSPNNSSNVPLIFLIRCWFISKMKLKEERIEMLCKKGHTKSRQRTLTCKVNCKYENICWNRFSTIAEANVPIANNAQNVSQSLERLKKIAVDGVPYAIAYHFYWLL